MCRPGSQASQITIGRRRSRRDLHINACGRVSRKHHELVTTTNKFLCHIINRWIDFPTFVYLTKP